MRILIASLVALSVVGSAAAQSGAKRADPPESSGPLAWRAEGKKVTYGAAPGDPVLAASCGDGPGYDLTIRLPGAYPGPWEDGQSMEVSVSSGVVPLANLSGAIEDNDDETHWLLRTRVGANHPIVARLFAGQSIQINAGRDAYRIEPREGRAELLAFRDACR